MKYFLTFTALLSGLSLQAANVWQPKTPAQASVKPEQVRIVKFGMDHRRIMDGNSTSIASYHRYRVNTESTLWTFRRAQNDVQITRDFDVDGDGDKQDDLVGCHPFSLEPDETMSPIAPWYDTSVGCQKMYGGGALFQANVSTPSKIFSEDGINDWEEGPAQQPRSNWTFFHETYEIFSPYRMYFVALWQKEDFNNGGADYPVSFDENSELRHLVMRYHMGIEGFRWVVRNSRQFYISEQIYRGASDTPGERGGKIHTVKPATIRWAEYNPKAPYHITFDSEKATFKNIDFDDVTSVGYLLFKDRLVSGYVGYKWYAFEADGVVHRPKQPSQSIDMAEIKSETVPPFYMSTCEVPYKLWHKVHRLNRSNTFAGPRGCNFDNYGDMGSMHFPGPDGNYLPHGQNEPATGIPLYDMIAWCNALSIQESKEPCYYVDSEFKERFREVVRSPLYSPEDHKKPILYVNWDANGYRLPTGGEWAAALGAQTTDGQAAAKSTQAVGSSAANANGIYDLVGNVWEPVWTFGDKLTATSFKTFTALGGDFRSPAKPEAGSASPYGDHPFNGHFGIGLRLVCRESGLSNPPASATVSAPKWIVKKSTLTQADPKRQLIAPLAKPWLEQVDIPGKPYAMGAFEVSFEKWKPVYDWAIANGYEFDNAGEMGSMAYWGFEKVKWKPDEHGPTEPVTGITLHDIVVWMNALSELEGRTPVYSSNLGGSPAKKAFNYRPLQLLLGEAGNQHRPNSNPDGPALPGPVAPVYTEDKKADGYRLAEAAEFAHARKAGGASPQPWGSKDSNAAQFAWTADNSGLRTHPVGEKKPNDWGLYDIAGNVSEFSFIINPRHRKMGYALRQGGGFIDIVQGMGEFDEREMMGGIAYPDMGFRVLRQNALQQHSQAAPKARPTVVAETKPPNRFFDALSEILAPPVYADEATGFDPLQGQVHRCNLYRTCVHRSSGLSKVSGIKWKFKTDGPVRSSPVVVNGILYVGSYDGHIYALDAETGSLKWKVKTPGRVSGSAAVVDGVVYIASEGKKLYALNAVTGTEKWSAGLGGTCAGSPAVINGKVIIGQGARWGGSETLIMSAMPLIAFDAETGKKLWQGSNGPQGYAAIATDGKYLYAGMNGSGYAVFDLAKRGKVKKSHNGGHQARQFMSMTVYNGKIYSPVTMRGSVLCMTDSATEVWHKATLDHNMEHEMFTEGLFGYEIFTDLAIDAGTVYAGCNDGKLYTFDAKNGVKGWTFDAGDKIQSSPSIADGMVYFGSWNGNLYGLDAASGKKKFEYELGDRIISSPWPGDGVLYVGCDDGIIYALK